jgi:hypothetical protein
MPPKRNSGLAEAPPHFHGHRDRLRARFREAGSDALADYEMLELILFRAIPVRDVKPLAKELLARFGSWPCNNARGWAGSGAGRARLAQRARASINGLVPMMFMTRVRL